MKDTNTRNPATTARDPHNTAPPLGPGPQPPQPKRPSKTISVVLALFVLFAVIGAASLTTPQWIEEAHFGGGLADGDGGAQIDKQGNFETTGSGTFGSIVVDVEDLDTSGAAGTAPVSDGASGLDMTDVVLDSELPLGDSDVSDTLTASIFKGSGTTTDAIDLATAEVAGVLPNANVDPTLTHTGGRVDGIPIGGTTKLTELQVDESGLVVDPAGDANASVFRVDVTDSPGLDWDEAGDEFDLNKTLSIPSHDIEAVNGLFSGDVDINGDDLNCDGTLSINPTLDLIFNLSDVDIEIGDLAGVGAMAIVSTTPGNKTRAQLNLQDDTALAADTGGVLNFSGIFTGAGANTIWAAVASEKANAVEADASGKLSFWTRKTGAAILKRVEIDEDGATMFGDVTDNMTVAPDGEATWNGTGRVYRDIAFSNADLGSGGTVPSSTILGNYRGWEYGIGDDSVVSSELEYFIDTSADMEVHISYYCEEAYATNNGEIQWTIDWSLTPSDKSEAVDAPTHSGTLDSGDIDLPATAKFLEDVSLGIITAANISDGDVLGITLTRVVLDDGNNPTAEEPVVVELHVKTVMDKLGESM